MDAHDALPGDHAVPDHRWRMIVDRISTLIRWTRWGGGNPFADRKIACCADMDWNRIRSTLDMLYFAGYCLDNPTQENS